MTAQQDVALLTIDEVAQRLKVSPSTVRRLIRRGGLKTVRLGRLIRVRPADLNDYIERHTEGEDE